MKRLLSVLLLLAVSQAGAQDEFQVLSAIYGAKARWINVVEKVRGSIQDNKLTIKVDNSLAPDAGNQGIANVLRIVYKVGTNIYAISVYQGSSATLPNTNASTLVSSVTTAAPGTNTMTTTSSPSPSTPSEPSVPADEWMKGLPPRAAVGYTQARDGAKSGKGLMGLRSWRAVWGNRLRDPMRGFVELEFAELLLSDSSKSENPKENPKVEEERKKQNLKEAAFVVQCVRTRNVTDPALLNRLDEVAKKLP